MCPRALATTKYCCTCDASAWTWTHRASTLPQSWSTERERGRGRALVCIFYMYISSIVVRQKCVFIVAATRCSCTQPITTMVSFYLQQMFHIQLCAAIFFSMEWIRACVCVSLQIELITSSRIVFGVIRLLNIFGKRETYVVEDTAFDFVH